VINIIETNVTIMIKNIDKSIEFYKSIGFELKQRWENHYAMMTTKGITIGLHPTNDKSTGSGSMSIGFMVEELDSIKTILNENDISFSERTGKSGDFVNFSDLDGTSLYFTKLNNVN
jgi:catechol 2,3-dioxygenase-like lactoylglutathione lyase family enzyme